MPMTSVRPPRVSAPVRWGRVLDIGAVRLPLAHFPPPCGEGGLGRKAEPGGGRRHRALPETEEARWYKRLNTGGIGCAPTPRPPPRPFAALRLDPPRKGEGMPSSHELAQS